MSHHYAAYATVCNSQWLGIDAVLTDSIFLNDLVRLGTVAAACTGGLLFLGGPMSATDQIQYNAHRIHGFIRLPLLTADWEVLGVYERNYRPGECGIKTCNGLHSYFSQSAAPGVFSFQPVVVLRNLRSAPCQRTV